MKTIPARQIDGDVAIGRGVAVGGKATIRGSAKVCHNLRVEGWLEAPNIKGSNKGLFKSEAQLTEHYPQPEEGWWALVGDTLPAQLYMSHDGKWEAQTDADGRAIVTGTPTVDDAGFRESVEGLTEDVETLKIEVRDNQAAIESVESTVEGFGDVGGILPELQSTVEGLEAWRQKYAGVPAMLEAIERWRQGLKGAMAPTRPIEAAEGANQVILEWRGTSLLEGGELGYDIPLPGATEKAAGVMTAGQAKELRQTTEMTERLRRCTEGTGSLNVNMWLGDTRGEMEFNLATALDALVRDGGFLWLLEDMPVGMTMTFLHSRASYERPGGDWETYRYTGPRVLDWERIIGPYQVKVEVATIREAEIDALFEENHKLHE